MSTGKPPRVTLQVRLLPKLHEALTKSAKASGRSLNAELMWRLAQSYVQDLLDFAEDDKS